MVRRYDDGQSSGGVRIVRALSAEEMCRRLRRRARKRQFSSALRRLRIIVQRSKPSRRSKIRRVDNVDT